MLTLECPCCGVIADETELAPGYEAHLKRFGPGTSPEAFEAYMFARKNPKAMPGSAWAMAELMAKGETGPLAKAFNMWRFKEGQFIDESVAAGVAH